MPNIQPTKAQISQAYEMLATEIRKDNRKYETAESQNAFNKLCMCIFGDFLTQSAIYRSWYYSNYLFIKKEDNGTTTIHMESPASSHDLELMISTEEAKKVLNDLVNFFKALRSFSATEEERIKNYYFFMNVWESGKMRKQPLGT